MSNAISTDDHIDAEVVTDEEFNAETGEVGGEVTVYSDPIVDSAINSLNTGTGLAYSSITGDDFDTKLRVLSAVTNSEPFQDNIGKTIQLKDIVIQKVSLKNRDNPNGPRVIQPRVILLDTEGNAYHAISGVLLGSVGNFIGILGQPSTWPAEGVATKFVRAKAQTGSMYLIEPVAVKAASKK